MSSVNLLYTEIKIPPVLNPETICDLNEQLILCLKQNVRFVVFTGNDSVFVMASILNGLLIASRKFEQKKCKNMHHF